MMEKESLSEGKGFLLALTTAFVSGVSIFINKFGVKGIDPYLFTGLKNLTVAFLLYSLALGIKEKERLKSLTLKEWSFLFLIGVVGGSLPFLLFFQGLSQTSAAHASFIHKNMFLLVAPLSFLFLKEKIEKRFFLTALLLLLGNAFVLKIKPLAFEKGDSLILLATFFWAVENVISKRTVALLSPRLVAFGRMFFGSLLIAVFLGLTGRLSLLAQLTSFQGGWIALTSLFLFAYVLSWYPALKHLRVSLATSVLTLGSPITTLLSFIFLGVLPDGRSLLGISLLVLGVALGMRIKELWRHRGRLLFLR